MTSDREKLFERVRAAKTYTQTANNPNRQRELEIAGFMAIFHPEVPAEKVKEMLNE